MKLRISLLVILISMLFASCGISTGKGTEQKGEEISVLRYDKLLNEYVRSNSFSAMQKLTMDYRQPTKILIEDVLAIGTVKDDTIFQRLQKFYSDTTLVRLVSDVEAKFPNLDEVEKGLNKGFRKLKKEVPGTKVPFVYSQISAFNESIILVDTLLGISLDKYMGEDYPLYKRFYYDYQCRSMRPERIVPDCFVFYLLDRYGMSYHEGTCLIDLMMHSGKINYVVQHLLGYDNIGDAIGYSDEENAWCKKNEKAIWEHICSNDHLHARDPMIYYDYQCRSMRPERIVPDCFVFYLLDRYGMSYHEGTCLIDLMMHSGKINYVVQHLLGYDNIGDAIGYSDEENAWCKKNEKAIWEHICSNDHLHARDPMIIRYYMKPAPAVEMLGGQAPASVGIWIGAQIVSSYMKKHKDMKLKDLLEFTDYHEMLNQSDYLAS